MKKLVQPGCSADNTVGVKNPLVSLVDKFLTPNVLNVSNNVSNVGLPDLPETNLVIMPEIKNDFSNQFVFESVWNKPDTKKFQTNRVNVLSGQLKEPQIEKEHFNRPNNQEQINQTTANDWFSFKNVENFKTNEVDLMADAAYVMTVSEDGKVTKNDEKLSAYQNFVKEQGPILNRTMSFHESTKKCKEIWDNSSESERKLYNKFSGFKENNFLTPETEAYLMFYNEQIDIYEKINIPFEEKLDKIGTEWKNMSELERKPYFKKAKKIFKDLLEPVNQEQKKQQESEEMERKRNIEHRAFLLWEKTKNNNIQSFHPRATWSNLTELERKPYFDKTLHLRDLPPLEPVVNEELEINAYKNFVQEHGPVIQKNTSFRESVKKCKEMWKNMSESERSPYFEQAHKDEIELNNKLDQMEKNMENYTDTEINKMISELVHKYKIDISVGQKSFLTIIEKKLKEQPDELQKKIDLRIIKIIKNLQAINAVKHGNAYKLQELLDQGVDPNIKDPQGNSLIHIWHSNVYKNEIIDAGIITVLVQGGADVNMKDNKGCPLIVKYPNFYPYGHTPEFIMTFKYLIDNGADVNAADKEGLTALHTCNLELAKILIAAGANVDRVDCHGCSPVYYAQDPELKKLLLKMGDSELEKYTKWPYEKDTLEKYAKEIINLELQTAARNSDITRAKEMIARGADVNDKNEDGNTALHILCSHKGSMEILELLMNHGANINEVNNEGKSAHSIAHKNCSCWFFFKMMELHYGSKISRL